MKAKNTEEWHEERIQLIKNEETQKPICQTTEKAGNHQNSGRYSRILQKYGGADGHTVPKSDQPVLA